MMPPVPRMFELGRLNTREHIVYMTECRWCLNDLHVVPNDGAVYCPQCDTTTPSATE